MEIRTKRIASMVIAATLILQTVAGLDLFPRLLSRPSRLFWPFLDYPMYDRAHYEGERVRRHVLVGTTDDGSELVIRPSDLGLNVFRFEKGVAQNAFMQNRRELVEGYAEHYYHRHGRRLLHLRLENHGWIVTREGAVPVAPEVTRTVNLERFQSVTR